jgi:hypothetical protein
MRKRKRQENAESLRNMEMNLYVEPDGLLIAVREGSERERKGEKEKRREKGGDEEN